MCVVMPFDQRVFQTLVDRPQLRHSSVSASLTLPSPLYLSAMARRASVPSRRAVEDHVFDGVAQLDGIWS